MAASAADQTEDGLGNSWVLTISNGLRPVLGLGTFFDLLPPREETSGSFGTKEREIEYWHTKKVTYWRCL